MTKERGAMEAGDEQNQESAAAPVPDKEVEKESPSPSAEESPAASTGEAPAETEAEDPAAGYTPAEGWYPDPNSPGSTQMRYWNGDAWTDKVKAGQVHVSSERRSPDERKAILAQQLQSAAARGLRIESQSDYQAVLVEGKPVNNTLHAILTIFTCLLWGIVWAVIAATGGEKREMIVVDEFGNVQNQRLGKA
jgi:hypothetical protein